MAKLSMFPQEKKKCLLVDSGVLAGALCRLQKGRIVMCGIVGLFLKDAALEPRLGAMLGGMLATLSDRGPDSAGFALYNRASADAIKITIRGPRGTDFAAIASRLSMAAGSRYLSRCTILISS